MLTDSCNSELLDGLKKSDVSAFNEIYELYSKPLYIYLLHKLKDPEVCNDVLQDLFVTIWEKRDKLTIETSLKSYLYQIARFKIVDLYREDRRYQEYLSQLNESMMVAPQVITERIDDKAKLEEVEKAINNLPEKMREIFILSRFKHQTNADIANIKNLSRQTVKNQISKALRLLRPSYMGSGVLLVITSFFKYFHFK